MFSPTAIASSQGRDRIRCLSTQIRSYARTRHRASRNSFPLVILLRSGAAHIIQVHRLRHLGRIAVCQRRLRMTSFSAVDRLRPQDHRCAISPLHLRHLLYSDYFPSLPLLSSPRIAFSVSHEIRPRDVATNSDWLIALALCRFVVHVPSSSPASVPGVASSTILP